MELRTRAAGNLSEVAPQKHGVLGPRIEALAPLSEALTELAQETRQASTRNERRGLVTALRDANRVLDRAEQEAGAFESTRSADLARTLRQARVSLALSSSWVQAAEKGGSRIAVAASLGYSEDLPAELERAAAAIRSAEHQGAALSGQDRFELDPLAPATHAIPPGALEEARRDPLLRGPLRQRHFPVQSVGRTAAPALAKLIAGKVEVLHSERIPRRGGFILVPTHASTYDDSFWAGYLCRDLPGNIRFLKRAGKPWDALFDRLGGAFPVVPGAKRGDLSLAAAQEFLRRGDVVVIFAEGRRVPNGIIGLVRDGAAKLALQADVPIVPVATYDGHKAGSLAKGRQGTLLAVGEPIEPQGAGPAERNIRVLCDRLQGSLAALYAEADQHWRQTHPSN